MLRHTHNLRQTNHLSALYILNFLRGVTSALVIFFNANFLVSRGISDEWLGALFAIGSLISIGIYALLPRILTTFGVYKVLLTSALLQFFIYMSLGVLSHIPLLLLAFVASLVVYVPLMYGLDILLEAEVTNENATGETRSTFLTVINIAYVISPFIAGLVLRQYSFFELYALAALFFAPFILLLHKNFSDFKDASYAQFRIKPIWTTLSKSADLRNIFTVQFLLNFFYSWMTIYTPIYLHSHLGFSLAATGIIFSIMLVPFILLEWPLGHYADKRYGEKEFLILGFAIIASTTYYLSYLTTPDIALWALALFVTRIGAAMIEVMNEIYFFKHVDNTDTDTISAFRTLSPLAYIAGPALGSLLLFFIPMQYMFGALGITMLIGILASFQLNDTK